MNQIFHPSVISDSCSIETFVGMAFNVLLAAATLVAAYFIYKFVSFLSNYAQARRAGFPIYVSPVLSKTIPWMILGPALQPLYAKYLPNWIFERLEICSHGWEFRGKRAWHDRLGDVFMLVTPDECSIYIADPVIGHSVLQRRNDFPQAPLVAKILGFFGPNVFSANGDEWKRHRRMFNLDEGISRTAWVESTRQAQVMLKHLVENPGNQTLEGLKSLAINVIGKAGYSQQEEWAPAIRTRLGEATSGKAAYFETLSLITEMLAPAAFLPTSFMRLPIMPRALRMLGYHMDRTPAYVQELLDDERTAIAKSTSRRNNFLSLLINLSDEDRRAGQGHASLSNDEISGSLFIFSTAGYETTANTMGYAVTLLAAYPEWQDWMREELQSLPGDPSTWKYEEVYPKCRRTLALMLETLRLYPPIMHTTRHIAEPQEVTDSAGKTHLLTPPMGVYVCQLSMHVDKSIWGPDANEFRPTRWIDDSGHIITPEKGTYIPWSGGPRICPGLKMSEVEFVATMGTLFRNARCDPLPVDGVESPETLRERLLSLVSDSVSKLALQMRNADGVYLRWTSV
ncbi:putative cytochrome P450 monooxygenase [Aspergillus pseudoustus]|uniref:Cytochrome P450 monooxygenase n=1 Tax=Aspergillus pseudoustus TaxID=1810923 RepID=A0ABR4JGF3_9EURO